MAMSKAKYGYLAALIDGEGCLSIGAGRRKKWGVVNYNPVISIANTNLEVIQWLEDNFGHKSYNQKPQTPRSKPSKSWRILSKKGIEVLLLAVLPYLIIKRKQAITLLDFVRLPRDENPEVRKMFWEKMRVLNERGVRVTTNTQDESPSGDLKIESGLHGDVQSVPVVTQDAVSAVS